MPRPDLPVSGPGVATSADIEAINRLFSEAFTDRYQRDGMAGVRVPCLNPKVWRYALGDAGEGAMVWRDPEGGIAAFNIAHLSGAEGWMGPLAVRPGLQDRGVGTAIVSAGLRWLQAHGARTIGLETMPRTVGNIGFYSRLGFLPGHLTVTVSREAGPRGPGAGDRLSLAAGSRDRLMAACAALTDRLRPGVDFRREIEVTAALGLGDTTLLREGDRLRGFALWHGEPLAAGRGSEELRVLKLVAEDLESFRRLIRALQAEAAAERLPRVSVRAQTAFAEAYGALVDAGFRVHWTDLRMTLRGAGEPRPGAGVVFSNWEI